MAHHFHHHHHHAPPGTCCSCCGGVGGGGGGSCSGTYHAPAQPHPPPADPLIEALISRLVLQPPPFHYSQSHSRKPHKSPTHVNKIFDHQHHQQLGHHPLISSLIARIDALESALHAFSTSPPPCQQRRRSCSLRDAAARVIQTQFRAFLARRSRELADFEHLAVVQSSCFSLRSSIRSNRHLDLDHVSRKVADLLIKLDSIQDTNVIIRDGKRRVSRDLECLVEYIDDLALKSRQLSFVAKKSVKSAGGRSKSKLSKSDHSEVVKNLRARVEKIQELSRCLESEEERDVELEGFHNFSDGGEKSRVHALGGARSWKDGSGRMSAGGRGVKKSVSFVENGNVYRLISNSDEASSSCDDPEDVVGHGEVLEKHQVHNQIEEMKGYDNVDEDDAYGNDKDDDDEEAEEEEEEAGKGSAASRGSSDGESGEFSRPRSEVKIVSRGGEYKSRNGKYAFSAPVPEKMESRVDSMKNRKNVKVVTS